MTHKDNEMGQWHSSNMGVCHISNYRLRKMDNKISKQ